MRKITAEFHLLLPDLDGVKHKWMEATVDGVKQKMTEARVDGS